MLKILHHHIYAGKLQRIFDDSCMVLVYQSLGSISVDDIKSQLESSIKSKQPKSGITASAFRIRNAVASGTKDEDFAKFFQASNLVVGWQVPQSTDSSSSTVPAATADFVSNRSKTIFDLCGDFRDRQSQHRVPQHIIAELINASMKLSASQPLALMACFHKSQRFTVGELKEWSKLDEGTVCLLLPLLRAWVEGSAV
jgi:hypothetical protein